MIHTVYINSQSEYNAVKKEFRKCLMTGGAVIRISENLSIEELHSIRNTFLPLVEPHNVASMIIDEVTKILSQQSTILSQ